MYEIQTLNFEEFLNFRDKNNIKELLFIKKQLPTLNSVKLEIQELFSEYIIF
jgi:hypothetical protein